MPGMATSAASSVGQQLGDRDQRVVGEHDVGRNIHFLGGAQPPILELQQQLVVDVGRRTSRSGAA